MKQDERTGRVCPNCAATLPPRTANTPLPERCLRCGAEIPEDLGQNIADKSSADSFPASDPPSY